MLKVSGEVFMNDDGGPFDHKKYERVAKAIIDLIKNEDVQVAVVVGAGNIWRYRDNKDTNMDRVASDKMGMLATNMNAKNLEFHLQQSGIGAIALSAFEAENVDMYDVNLAREALNDGEVVVLAGGTGNPYFTTDSAAALRALELECDVLMKATKVDGVYTADPMKDKNAERYDTLTYDKALAENLQVMDLAAVALCRDNELPVLVFDFTDPDNLDKVYKDSNLGTLITS